MQPVTPAAPQLVRAGAVRARLRDGGAAPGHPVGIPQPAFNERNTEDSLQTTRTIHPPGRKRA